MSIIGKSFDLSELKGSVAVVTGAANFGIGYGIAQHCVEKLRMHVAIVDLQEDLAKQAAAELAEKAGGNDVRTVGIAADVTQPESVQRCLQQVQSCFSGIPIGAVFANAGVSFSSNPVKDSVLRGSLEAWDMTMGVNVRGVLLTLRTFVPVLQTQEAKSVVVTTASTAAYLYGVGAYGVSKHACLAMTESLHDELGNQDKVSVHVLCPSIVGTNLMSTTNRAELVAAGKAEPRKTANKPPEFMYGMPMTPESHAQQVFDRIARGEFYLVTENERPYVNHDFPLGAKNNFKERADGMLVGQIVKPKNRYQSPFMREVMRRTKEDGKSGDFLSGAGRNDRQKSKL